MGRDRVAYDLSSRSSRPAASFGELDAAVEATWPRGLLLIHVLAASFIVAAAGTTASERPGVAAGLALVGLAVSLPVLGGLTALPVDARNTLVASAGLAPAGAALVAQGWSRPRRRWPAAVAAVLSVTAVAIHALTVNPAAEPACMRLCLPVDVVLSGVGSRPGLGLAAGPYWSAPPSWSSSPHGRPNSRIRASPAWPSSPRPCCSECRGSSDGSHGPADPWCARRCIWASSAPACWRCSC